MLKVVEEGRAVEVVHMDFSETFVRLPHGVLMQMMHRIHCNVEVPTKITPILMAHSMYVGMELKAE